MAWVRLDDAMPHHPKTMRAGVEGFALDVAGIAYSNRYDTDGFIGDDDLPAVLPCLKSPKKFAQKLVEASRWERDNSRGGWHIHDIHDYQPTAAETRQERESARDRMRAIRENRKGSSVNVRPNKEECSPEVRNPVPSRPVVTKKTASASASVTDIEAHRFEAFWSVYPKRADRGHALKAWKSATKKAAPDVIVAAAERYANDPRRKPDYTKNGATWLNGECWLDEAPATQASRVALNNPTGELCS